MAEETPNHGYNTPSKGERDWHVPLNENFEQIDSDVPIWATDENRERYSAESGAHFISIDTGDVYEGDGSAWNQIGTISDGDITVDVDDDMYSSVSPASNRIFVPETGAANQPAIDYLAENGVHGVVQLLPTT
jgi:glutathione synthase/RimK-type ligase-like ATP-grasp enzyme